MTRSPRRVILVAGAESRGLTGPDVRAVGGDLAAALRDGRPTVVVPMTLGRDPDLPEAAAQTLRWAARNRAAGELLLAPRLGTLDHLVGWLRGAVRAIPSGYAALLVAPSVGQEPDADLFKAAHLVRAGAPDRLVEAALLGGVPDVDDGIARCRALGAAGTVMVPASLVPPPTRPDATTSGPLLGPAALAALVRARAAEAACRWETRRDDGLSPTAVHDHHHDHRPDRTVPAAAYPKEARAHVG
ncbi:hypothetical protein [Actinocorallia sp. A-T 12471]|uniref:hypothetical protein n=1 Tax=Actinocorallia sp. A-T 12471 TaxID=3089813 RepID=UPI0029CEA9A5|nr:hypothetical protein [Actinocorallia sp. A-T 12471]MDX6740435.1 hypothetical protein [Actinocorallia sp. A-T 12471]